MLPQELEQSLRDGLDDLRVITGENSAFIRPTFWGYNDETLQIYAAHGLKMLLTDVNNRDGIRLHNIFGFRDRIREQFARARQMIARGALPELHGQVPLVITLHDLNTMTAHNLAHYLHVMTEEAARTGLTLAAKPFYDDAREIAEVASLRAYPAEMVTVIAKDTRKYTLPDNTVAGAATTQNTAQPATAVPVSYNPGNTASTLR
jgi:peptidoglycan/xylan/chitin deacetylase (PgdA/CDA1 family)